VDSTEDFFPGKISTFTFDSSRSQELAEQKLSEICLPAGPVLFQARVQLSLPMSALLDQNPSNIVRQFEKAAPAESAETNCPEAAMDGGYKEGDYVAQERRPRVLFQARVQLSLPMSALLGQNPSNIVRQFEKTKQEDSTEDFFPGKISTSTFDSSRSQEPAEQKLSEISVDEIIGIQECPK
jgi:hypothetical protein